MANQKIKIKRAPVLTLWAAVVAVRIGYNKNEALTLGKAVGDSTHNPKGGYRFQRVYNFHKERSYVYVCIYRINMERR